jgi:hypothetical protein
MANITNYETKTIECDKCGWVGTVAKFIPLKQAWCGGCGSLRIRLHKERLTQDAADGCKAGHHLVMSGSNKCMNCGKRVNRHR